MKTTPTTFIIDCPLCKAKVAAIESGRAENSGQDENGQLYGYIVYVCKCPICKSILVGESSQLDFEGWDADEDRWTDIIRVYLKPPKIFSSFRIPRVVRDSLNEADLTLQVGANTAACVMLGRALEALCRDVLDSEPEVAKGASTDPTATNEFGNLIWPIS